MVQVGALPSYDDNVDANLTCSRYYKTPNGTIIIIDESKSYYEGIPQNLIFNVVIWLIMFIIFCFLRKLAWDYGRMALLSRTETRFLTLFYGDQNPNTSELSYLHSAMKGTADNIDKPEQPQHQPNDVHGSDEGFISWIRVYFKVTDEHILQRSGRDAIQYLSFQRYLMVYMTIVVVVSIGIILPINFVGEQESDKNKFGRTTISNLDPNSPVLWIHAVFAVVFLAIAMAFTRHFTTNLQYEEDEQATKTLMVSNIPKHLCYKSTVLQHFNEAYPDAPVHDAQFAYDVRKLIKLNDKRREAWDCWRISEALSDKMKERPLMIKRHCGFISQCCTCCKRVDAIDFYKSRETKYQAKVDLEKPVAFNRPLGISFVTFENRNVSHRVFRDFQMGCKGLANPTLSSVSSQLETFNWEVKYAPAPDNIYWENLALNQKRWWFRAIWVNVLLGLFLFFLTTPTVVLSLLYQVAFVQVFLTSIMMTTGTFVSEFVPPLLLWLISALMPLLVELTDTELIGHWTKSVQHYAVMLKSYIFLLLMILVLPSLGLTSANALLEWTMARNREDFIFHWQCIFLPNNGAFFVNYVITAAFIGSVFKLLRLGQLLQYAIRMAWARSEAERIRIRRNSMVEFDFGSEYAFMMCVFAVVMAYSLICPLITPFGLVYFIMKYAVDRYNIYFVYGPSRIDKGNHAAAVNFVIFGVIMLQFFVTFFTIIRADNLQGIAIFSVVALTATLFILIGRVCFGWFRPLSPITYKTASDETERLSELSPAHDRPFLASVLVQDAAGATAGQSAADADDIHDAQSGYGALQAAFDSPASSSGQRQVKDRGASAVSDSESV